MAEGGLRADQISRVLVPSLLEKANRMRLGKVRTGSSDATDTGGLQELGFLLGQRNLERLQ